MKLVTGQRRMVWLVMLVCASFMQAQRALRTVVEVRSLSPDAARLSVPVVLRGTVMTLSGWKDSFFFEDGTAGISIDRLDHRPELKQGDRIEVRGVTNAGSFAPIVVSSRVRVFGNRPVRRARLFQFADLAWGAQDSQWVSLQGVVRGVDKIRMLGTDMFVMRMDLRGDEINVRFEDADPAKLSALIGSTVTVQGVCATIFNDRRQFIGVRLFSGSLRDIRVDEQALADPFDRPLRSLTSLLQFRGRLSSMDAVRVRGVVLRRELG